MLEIYLCPNEDTIHYNDDWFDTHVDTMKQYGGLSKLVKQVDQVDVKDGFIVPKFGVKGSTGLLDLKYLSTGCKTVLNVAAFQDMIFTLSECGDNALDTLIMLDNGKVFAPNFLMFGAFDKEVKVTDETHSTTVQNSRELHSLFEKYFDA